MDGAVVQSYEVYSRIRKPAVHTELIAESIKKKVSKNVSFVTRPKMYLVTILDTFLKNVSRYFSILEKSISIQKVSRYFSILHILAFSQFRVWTRRTSPLLHLLSIFSRR